LGGAELGISGDESGNEIEFIRIQCIQLPYIRCSGFGESNGLLFNQREAVVSSLWPIKPDLLAELVPGIVQVIRLNLDLPRERWVPLGEVLTAAEQVRAARFRFDAPRRQFIICRAALRQLLGSHLHLPPQEIEFEYGPQGKPEIGSIHRIDQEIGVPIQSISASIESNLDFNVSHSGEIGLIALTRGSAIGVDVEEYNSAVEILRLAERYFSPAEAETLKKLPAHQQQAGFYRGWTCKEAYIKAKGSGLSLPLSSFSVEIDPDRPAALIHVDDLPDEPVRWTIRTLEVDLLYAAAIVVERPDCQFICREWPGNEP
jgi:4'-phosphopantetheinyl transferase